MSVLWNDEMVKWIKSFATNYGVGTVWPSGLFYELWVQIPAYDLFSRDKYQFWYLYTIKSKVVDENQFIKCLFIARKGLKMIEIIVHKPYSFWFRIKLYEPLSLLNDNWKWLWYGVFHGLLQRENIFVNKHWFSDGIKMFKILTSMVGFPAP